MIVSRRILRRLAGAVSVALLATTASAVTSFSYRGMSYLERPAVTLPAPGGVLVDTSTGNVVFRHRLFSVAGVGIPLELALTYNSDRRLVASPYGLGWSLSHAIRYVADAAGNVRIVWGDGRVDLFTKSGGDFASPAGVHLTLTRPAAGQYLLRSKHGLELRFDDAEHRKLTSIAEPNGNAMTLGYDGARRLVQITDPGGRSYTFAYDGLGRLTEIADPNLGGRTWRLGYDPSHQLVEIVDPLGHRVGLTYADGLLQAVTDPRGSVASLTYVTPPGFPATRLPGTISQAGSSVAYGFDAVARTTTVTDPNGHPWQYGYDGAGRLSSVTDPAGSQATYSWDAGADLTSFTDRNGHTRTFAYDALGNLIEATVPFGAGDSATALWQYEPICNRVASFTDLRGNSWTYQYDPECNLVATVDPAALGTTSTRVVDGAGQVTALTDGSGRTTTFSYDADGNPATVTDALGGTTELTFDAGSRLTGLTDPLGHAFAFAYDALDRLTSTTDALGDDDALAWDAAGNLLSYTDREGYETRYAYDVLGRLDTVTDALGNPDSRAYDANGNRTSYVDRRGNTWLQAFDDRNRVVSRTNPLGGAWTYAYDDAGNLVAHTDAKGQVTSFTYDFSDRLIREQFADGTRADLTYDANGNPLTEQDRIVASSTLTSDYTYTYDAANRRTGFTDLLLSKSVLYAYDGAGRLTSKTGPEGDVTVSTYDGAGRLASQSALGGVSTFAHDAAGNRTLDQRPNGVATTYAYDANGRLAVVDTTGPAGPRAPGFLASALAAGPLLQRFGYTRDARGLVTSTVRETGETIAVTYGALGRPLVEQGHPAGASAYTLTLGYDANGNRVTHGATSHTFDAANRVTSSTAGAITLTYAHDANGARTAASSPFSTATYTWDARNRLVGYTAGLVGRGYTYDVVDRLVATTANGYNPRRVMYGSDDPIAEDTDGDGTLETRYSQEPPDAGDLLVDAIVETFWQRPYGLTGEDRRSKLAWVREHAYRDQGPVREVDEGGTTLQLHPGGNQNDGGAPATAQSTLATGESGAKDGSCTTHVTGAARTADAESPSGARDLLGVPPGWRWIFEGKLFPWSEVVDPNQGETLNPGAAAGASSPPNGQGAGAEGHYGTGLTLGLGSKGGLQPPIPLGREPAPRPVRNLTGQVFIATVARPADYGGFGLFRFESEQERDFYLALWWLLARVPPVVQEALRDVHQPR